MSHGARPAIRAGVDVFSARAERIDGFGRVAGVEAAPVKETERVGPAPTFASRRVVAAASASVGAVPI
jgi:hypothetical protein